MRDLFRCTDDRSGGCRFGHLMATGIDEYLDGRRIARHVLSGHAISSSSSHMVSYGANHDHATLLSRPRFLALSDAFSHLLAQHFLAGAYLFASSLTLGR